MAVGYLDASALVKLVVAEPETEELRGWIGAHPTNITSAIARTEVGRVARRRPDRPELLAAVEDLFRRLMLLDLHDRLLRRAAELDPSELRTLDAIHLASAIELGTDLDHFVTYDRQLGAAASMTGLNVVTPR